MDATVEVTNTPIYFIDRDRGELLLVTYGETSTVAFSQRTAVLRDINPQAPPSFKQKLMEMAAAH